MINNPFPKLNTFLVNVLGCKVNHYDARQIEQLLSRYGLHASKDANHADLIIIHTCGVTAAAARKSRQTIRRMQRENPCSIIAVTGCAAMDDLTAIEPTPVIRVPAGKDWLQHIAEAIESLNLPIKGIAQSIETDSTAVSFFKDQTRAYLKIQDGCDIGCSFCIVPQLRKQPRDKPLDTAIREATLLTQNGHREIVVTGVSVGLYGRNSDTSLADVLRQLIQIPDIGRIRLSSLHPAELTDELLDVWGGSAHIMPHLHLSLQSGSNSILQAMRRGYSTEEYLNAVDRARHALKNPAFTTDIIVGFPGETDAYFEESYQFCKQVGFAQMHIFHYSPRPRTPAAKMKQQINNQIASERSDRMHQLATTMSTDYYEQFRDQTLNVLIEQSKNGIIRGYSEHYIPVEITNASIPKGQLVQVHPKTITNEGISGTIAL